MGDSKSHLLEGIAAPEVVLVVVLGHAEVASPLFEVEGGLDKVTVLLQGQLSSAGGDGHCEGVDNEALTLPQVHLHLSTHYSVNTSLGPEMLTYTKKR